MKSARGNSTAEKVRETRKKRNKNPSAVVGIVGKKVAGSHYSVGDNSHFAYNALSLWG